jgi:hypothetical protein
VGNPPSQRADALQTLRAKQLTLHLFFLR